MVVDYSKWDKLELSDDSDIEVHPNVDKKSFIRWKQRDIHEKREQMKFRIAQLEVNLETNEDLLKRVNKLLNAAESGYKLGLDIPKDVALSQEGETKLKPSKATSPEQPRYTDMIESMLLQVVAENTNPETVVAKIEKHKEMIEGAMKDEKAELDKLIEERKQHITAEDIHTGWDSTIVYGKDKDAASGTTQPSGSDGDGGTSDDKSSTPSGQGQSSNTKNSTETHIETLNTPSRTKPRILETGLEEVLPATEKFGEIKVGDYDKAYLFMMDHPYIITEGQKDALAMSAFDFQLKGETDRAEQAVWASTIIQYSIPLGKGGCKVLFDKIKDPQSPAAKVFVEAYESVFKHIKTRCEVLKDQNDSEVDENDVAVQLKSLDPETEITISIPEAGSKGYEIYEKFSEPAKTAIESHNIDEMNKYLQTLSVEDGEKFVADLGDSGILQIEKKVYEPEEWEAVQQGMNSTPTIDDVD